MMALSTGSRLGPYEILFALGAGGMGEVYRARDGTLQRDVALKILPEVFALDANRLARFRREAQVLASLNHPNIAAIYGFEESTGAHALVLELVEGPTLANRLAQRPIPMDEALAIARQIAEALGAAHEQSVIHRDLKPANIKITPDGVVKVLDFGLAKLAQSDAAGGRVDVTGSPTITSPAMMTGVGVLLGTAAYMSPEQAKGREADKRSDIWAFGAVLYEMLAGKRPFDGEDMTDVLGAVVRLDPDWDAIPSDVPLPVRTLLQTCLVKNPRLRIADISTALFVLDKNASLAPPASPDAAASQAETDAAVAEVRRVLARSMQRRVAVVGIAAVFAGAVIATAFTWLATRPADVVPPGVSRLAFAPSGTAALTTNPLYRDLAITADGSRIVYVGNGGTQLFVRALDALEPVAVFTGAPRGPVVSPDGQWIAFGDGLSVLKKVAMTGGAAVTVPTDSTSSYRGLTWETDGTIIVATESGTRGLVRVATTGEPPAVLTRPDHAKGERYHLSPEMLPGGRAVLFTITAVAGGVDAAQVAVLDLGTGTRKILVRGASDAHYVPSGHLLYSAAGAVFAVSFDLARLETRGTAVPVISDVAMPNAGGVDVVVARNGTLAYVAGDNTPGVLAPRTLVWVDRQGRETPISAPPGPYLYPRVSPEGTRVAFRAVNQDRDIWIWDLVRTRLIRATFDPGYEGFPLWTPDGRRVIFNSDRAGARNLFWEAADGTGTVERLTESPNRQEATAVSADRRLIFTEQTPRAGEDVMEVQLDGPRRIRPLVATPFNERNGIVSPDGRWLAYESNESGRFEISVRLFPDVNGGRWQVSTDGGTRPLWARSGRELFYVAPTGALMRVGVDRGLTWAATTPTQVVPAGYLTISPDNNGRTYDVAVDDQRFLLMKERVDTEQRATPPQIIVVQNWTEELKRLLPVR